MTQFRDGFMMKSPLSKHQQKFYDKARELSEKSGTPGDYNRDDPEVREQLDRAEEAEKSHESDSAAKMSPFQGAYTSGADGMVYFSNRDDFKELQDNIVSAAKTSIKSERDNKKYQDYKNLSDNEFTAKYKMNKKDYIAAINKANKEKEEDGNA